MFQILMQTFIKNLYQKLQTMDSMLNLISTELFIQKVITVFNLQNQMHVLI